MSWKPATDKLPPPGRLVLILTANRCVFTAKLAGNGAHVWRSMTGNLSPRDVTHWHKLPKLPEEKP